MERILVVEDDGAIAAALARFLRSEGFSVQTAEGQAAALAAIEAAEFDLVLLDVGLKDGNGFSVCSAVRQRTDSAVIFLSASGDEYSVVTGLELGADDYMTKPFEGKELLARVKAVLRRSAPASNEKDTLSFPGLTVSLEKYEVYYQGKPVEMPPKELEVLYFLASHQNRVFTREQLLEQVWGFDFFGDSRTVDVHIKRLREKVENVSDQWALKTVWGVGYKFEVVQ